MKHSEQSAFALLLSTLDPDVNIAAEYYEELRYRLIQILKWKGCFEVDSEGLADNVLERVADKISDGAHVENIRAYSIAVLRFVWLEHTRKRREIGVDELPEVLTLMDTDEIDGPDLRLRCLRHCMLEVTNADDERSLIIGYYDNSDNSKNKDARRQLAAVLGLSTTALKVKACRLRNKLEKCINECVSRETISGTSNTSNWGESE